MEGAEIIVLPPVVRVERDAGVELSDIPAADVIDMKAFRARRARAMVVRRSARSLLTEFGSP